MGMKVNRKLETSPCLHCEDREPGCHGKCEKYQKWLEPILKARDARKKDIDAKSYEIARRVRDKERKRKRNGKS